MIDAQPLSPRAARAISAETNHVLASMGQLGKELRDEGIETVHGNYLINNVIADSATLLSLRFVDPPILRFSERVRLVAEAAAYLMHEYGLELMGWSSFGRGGLVLGKGDVPMLSIGTEVWGQKDQRESLALYSDGIARTRGADKNVIRGGSITSLVKRAPAEVFDPNTYTFLSDELIRIMAETSVATAVYRKKVSVDYSKIPAEDMFRLINGSVTGIINFSELDVANPIRKWLDDTKKLVSQNENSKETGEEIKAHMKKGLVCVINLCNYNRSGNYHSTPNIFGIGNRKYSVIVFRPDEFGVMKFVSRKYVGSISEIEHEYPHIASAYHLRKIEVGHDHFDSSGYSEAYGCVGAYVASITAANRRTKNFLMRAAIAVFPETMYIEKDVVTEAAPVSPASPVSAVDSLISSLEF